MSNFESQCASEMNSWKSLCAQAIVIWTDFLLISVICNPLSQCWDPCSFFVAYLLIILFRLEPLKMIPGDMFNYVKKVSYDPFTFSFSLRFFSMRSTKPSFFYWQTLTRSDYERQFEFSFFQSYMSQFRVGSIGKLSKITQRGSHVSQRLLVFY